LRGRQPKRNGKEKKKRKGLGSQRGLIKEKEAILGRRGRKGQEEGTRDE